jgi:thiazole synthase ThiGH ThiG subunit
MSNFSQTEGVRMSCATIARNIIGANQKYKTDFINHNGLRALVALIDFDVSRVREEQYTQWILERVNDIRDYLEMPGTSGAIDPVVAKKLVNENIKSKLIKLKSASQDNDIVEDSIDVLGLLANY